jgi:imidazolonepropionase-like amidohydrolase
MIPLEAIRAATINAAVLLGRSQARGSVAPASSPT